MRSDSLFAPSVFNWRVFYQLKTVNYLQPIILMWKTNNQLYIAVECPSHSERYRKICQVHWTEDQGPPQSTKQIWSSALQLELCMFRQFDGNREVDLHRATKNI